MQKSQRRNLFVCSFGLLLAGCTPERFEVVPCLLGGQLAFRLYPIEGWLSDYVPRPSSVLVAKADGTHEWPGMWSATLHYFGDDDAFDKKVFVGSVVRYGQQFPGWEVSQPAKALEKGHKYWVRIDGGRGHTGWAEFTVGQQLATCA